MDFETNELLELIDHIAGQAETLCRAASDAQASAYEARQAADDAASYAADAEAQADDIGTDLDSLRGMAQGFEGDTSARDDLTILVANLKVLVERFGTVED